MARLRILPKGVLFALSPQYAAMTAKMSQKSLALQFLPRIGRQGAQGFLPPVIENEGNRLAQVRQAFFACLPLPVGARRLGAVCNVPWAMLFDDSRESVVHVCILAPPPASVRLYRNTSG
jgi:hypothetical protein